MCVELVPELIDWSDIFIAFFKGNGGRGKVRTCDPCRVKAGTLILQQNHPVHHVTLMRNDDQVGQICVNFPRLGYRVKVRD